MKNCRGNRLKAIKALALVMALCGTAFAQSASFPSAVVGQSQLMVAANNVQTTLANNMGTGDTTFTVNVPTGFVANSLATIDLEIVRICNVNGSTISVGTASSCPNVGGRGWDNTTVTTHSGVSGSAAKVSLFIDAWHHNAPAAEIIALETALGANLSNIPGSPSGGVIPINKGGTNASTVNGALANLGAPSLTGSNTFSSSNTFSNVLTASGGFAVTGEIDASGSTHSLPFKVGLTASLPVLCTVGEKYFATDATAGSNDYSCTATNTWTQDSINPTVPFSSISTGTNSAASLTLGSGSALIASGGTVDVGAALRTRPFLTGLTASLPATCTVGDKYFATDATAGSNDYNCTATNSWTQETGGGSGLPSATGQLQYLRTKANAGNLTTVEFAGAADTVTTAYNYTAIAPGGSISAGSDTITLSVCPLGVRGGTDANYVYISGGSGIAEASQIIGGTCAGDGIHGGTIIASVANTHTGAWTIQSATAGVMEAYLSASAYQTVPAKIRIPAGIYTIYAPVTVTENNVSIRGAGQEATVFNVPSGFNATPQFVFNNTSVGPPPFGTIDFGDLEINYQVAGVSGGVGVTINNMAYGVVSNLMVQSAYVGISATNVANVHFSNLLELFIVNIGLFSSNPSFGGGFNVHGAVITMASTTSGEAMLFEGEQAGATLSDIFTVEGLYGIEFLANNSNPINEIQLSNFIVASAGGIGIFMNISNASAGSSRVSIRDGILDCTTTATQGIYLSATTNGNITPAEIKNVQIYYYGTAGIQLGGILNGDISGVNVRSAGGGGSAILLTAPGNNGVRIRDSSLGMSQQGNQTGSGRSTYAIQLDGNQHSNIWICDNIMAGATAQVANSSTDLTTVEVCPSNRLADINTYASAAAFPLPAFPNFIMSGTTGVTSVTGIAATSAGRTGTLITSGGAVAFTSGATIGNSCTTTQNKLYNWYVDSTPKFWINGPGC